MKYTVFVRGKPYEVEIGDLNTRPIIVHVDGTQFEVLPEIGQLARPADVRRSDWPHLQRDLRQSDHPAATDVSVPINPAASGNTLTAPLPGTIVDVFVKPGDNVEAGQVVLVIEAMKMKNSIRSVWSGVIAEVLVSAGQSVAHKQVLIRFDGLD